MQILLKKKTLKTFMFIMHRIQYIKILNYETRGSTHKPAYIAFSQFHILPKHANTS